MKRMLSLHILGIALAGLLGAASNLPAATDATLAAYRDALARRPSSGRR